MVVENHAVLDKLLSEHSSEHEILTHVGRHGLQQFECGTRCFTIYITIQAITSFIVFFNGRIRASGMQVTCKHPVKKDTKHTS